MLEVRDLSLAYGQSRILHGVGLTAAPGRVTCLMGNNGMGKTSLLKAIAGRHPYSGGTITLDGAELRHPTAAKAARAGIAYVPQGREIFPMMSVAENLETGLAVLPKDRRQVGEEVFELFPVLAQMRARRGGDLSGGQQQQLAIARALVMRPRVLLLDEPTEGIQPNVIDLIGDVIARLRDAGEICIVLVEQNFDFARRLADHYVTLRRGVVEVDAPAEEMPPERLLEALSL
ncbi:urea ABC transporter ATP-binding subunit UrtE [Roseobacter sp. HKCCA0434]|uniref:urea ABC transporter ATP-binding subunit UrtE n=1 Tax=Roseobacter sp. HKCCA0434 TaxID=3079297 RepID=UPI0029058C4D|nr:urea ABC transporter ATP-binding subunit UrtE [Roseobacter sp. HKCCA0434]